MNLLELRRTVLTGLAVASISLSSSAQSISGFILDENNDPIPYASVFVRELGVGASADEQGKYFLTIDPGVYNLVVSSIGFESRTLQVVVRDKPVVKNFYLESSSVTLEEVVVRVKRRDPAYEIIQLAIQNRERYLSQVKSFRIKVYVRASEEIDRKAKTKATSNEVDSDERLGPPIDPAEEQRRKDEAKFRGMNLTEMTLILNYQYPGHYKEERVGFSSYGTRDGLYIPIFSNADFNFYRNLVDLPGISEVPAISPLSRTSILSYRFRLEDITKENGSTVYKISFTPRKSGDATGKGYIVINDSTWNINRIEFSLHKGGLRFYDDFTIRQRYEKVSDSLWIPSRQEFVYQTKAGPKLFKGNTVLVYSDYEKDFVYPPKFFGNEVAVTTKEAYERDSSYWNASRPEPLTLEQQRMVQYRDSVAAAHKDKAYLDSIQARYNRVTLGEILYSDIGFRNDSLRRWINFSSLLSTVGFEIVGGWRLGPRVSYWRYFDNGRILGTSVHTNVGLKNMDVQGSYSLWTMYDARHMGTASIRFGRSFSSINPFDAYLNQLRISNYIVHNFLHLFQRRELFNGFYFSTDINFGDRQPVTGYDATSIIDEVYEQGEALDFQGYQALITYTRAAYTPFQRYMSEPNRKVVLGSKFPTFIVSHTRGWNGVFGSDINFDYLEGMIEQTLRLGTLGSSRYTMKGGAFVNKRVLHFIDLKRFRQSDPYLWSDPMQSFQLLDTALSTTKFYIEAHYLHHFNGAMINNIPIVKKLRLRTVAGAGFMWIRENGYRHEEIFGGVERVFKLGARRRLKVGVYGVLAESNFSAPRADWKISFDIIDTWKRDWSY